mmetsp:Transcript_23364/g.55525  ORF Transcript_23364/g.55525 Transcript_23364/m.55525 type:complete len:246 (+) Transcript_23364:1539-2276(+)
MAVGDVDQLMAALGLVHVMRRDQHRDALAGEQMDLVPELAPRLGVDAGRGFVQQQQARPVQQAGGEREALLPAAGQRAGQLPLPAGQAQALQRAIHRVVTVRHREQPGDEVEVLADGEVVVEPELLRHIADLALDGLALAAEIQAQHLAFTGVRRQQAAEHAQRGGFTAAVGAEEADDAAGADLQVDRIDHLAAAIGLGEPPDVDGELGHGVTSSGWPGCRRSASSGFTGRASTRNTSLSRCWLE